MKSLSSSLSCLALCSMLSASPAFSEEDTLIEAVDDDVEVVQEAPPTELGPELPLATPVDESIPLDVPVVEKSMPISIGQNEKISVDGFGVLDANNGGLEDTVWQNSERGQVDRLLDAITGGMNVAPLRDLAVRLLASSSLAPERGSAKLDFLQKRLETLFILGSEDKVLETIIALPANMVSKEAAQLSGDILLLKGDEEGVCRQTPQWVGMYDDEYFQKLMIFCQMKQGQREQAELGLGLLEEQNRKPGKFFEQLVKSLSSSAPKAIEMPATLTPTEVAMAVAAGQKKLPVEYLKTAPLPVLKMVAGNEAFSLETRASAAERAVLYNALDVKELAKLYEAMNVSSSKGKQSVGIFASASYYTDQKKISASKTRLKMISKAHNAYASAGLRQLWLALYGDDLAVLKSALASGEAADEAGNMIDSLIYSGNVSAASSISKTVNAKNPAASFVYEKLLLLASDRPLAHEEWTVPAQGKDISARDTRRIYRLQTLGEALGLTIKRTGAETVDKARVSTVVEQVSPRNLSMLDAASNDGRKGEALLISAILIGASDLSKVDDTVLDKVVRVLVNLGHEKEARQLAVQSIIAIY